METQTTTGDVYPISNAVNELIDQNERSNQATDNLRELLQQIRLPGLKDLLSPGKRNFLVFRNNRYVNVLTDNIAFFSITEESPVITCFDKEEYCVNYPLDHIQQRLSQRQFFRLNRQCLINFSAIKEVENYFGRKLLVNTIVPVKSKLVVSRERVTEFLHWLDNR